MDFKQPKQYLIYDEAVKDIIAAGGSPSPQQWVWLYDAAKRAVGDECPSFIDIPVVVGNCILHPLTIGAALWWRHHGEQWYGKETESNILAYAYAHAHANNADAFHASKMRCDLALIAWQFKLSTSCTLNQLAWGIDKLNGQYDTISIGTPNEARVDCPSAIDWGDIIAKLCAAYHQPPEYFLWKLSESGALELLAIAPRPFDKDQTDLLKARALSEFMEIKMILKRSGK
jgi:hypothetical protein